VLYDDRDARPGVKFAEADLLGIPHRLVLGERGIEAGTIEYKHRRAQEPEDVARDGILGKLLRAVERPEELAGDSARPLLTCAGARAADDPQTPDPALRELLIEAVSDASSFQDRFDAEVWLVDMSRRLTRQVNDAKSGWRSWLSSQRSHAGAFDPETARSPSSTSRATSIASPSWPVRAGSCRSCRLAKEIGRPRGQPVPHQHESAHGLHDTALLHRHGAGEDQARARALQRQSRSAPLSGPCA
jgi:prolyl-tRNA synthetase